MNSKTFDNNNTCGNCDPAKLPATVQAFLSPFCGITGEAEAYKFPQMYFLMTPEMEITGFTYEPSIQEGQHCVAASETECEFIVQFQINWPGSNPHYQQLEAFRAYHKARQALYEIRGDYPKKKHREHKAKIETLRNLP
ncbi:hypothetical protein LOY24_04160 [Pseudomonas putida]|uniref:hypothetical protein n=1 Tax=Pseudomonas putida TaxID=303 RepID=UPI00215F055B|nr:hypothetical protein [Pseudomonas putida]UVL79340.1 hypothetical protein LOY24_04160 [Pseudomonas putida]